MCQLIGCCSQRSVMVRLDLWSHGLDALSFSAGGVRRRGVVHDLRDPLCHAWRSLLPEVAFEPRSFLFGFRLVAYEGCPLRLRPPLGETTLRCGATYLLFMVTQDIAFLPSFGPPRLFLRELGAVRGCTSGTQCFWHHLLRVRGECCRLAVPDFIVTVLLHDYGLQHWFVFFLRCFRLGCRIYPVRTYTPLTTFGRINVGGDFYTLASRTYSCCGLVSTELADDPPTGASHRG